MLFKECYLNVLCYVNIGLSSYQICCCLFVVEYHQHVFNSVHTDSTIQHICHPSTYIRCNTEETFLQHFLEILNRPLQNFEKMFKNGFLSTVSKEWMLNTCRCGPCTHTYTHTHIYIYIYIYVCVCLVMSSLQYVYSLSIHHFNYLSYIS